MRHALLPLVSMGEAWTLIHPAWTGDQSLVEEAFSFEGEVDDSFEDFDVEEEVDESFEVDDESLEDESDELDDESLEDESLEDESLDDDSVDDVSDLDEPDRLSVL